MTARRVSNAVQHGGRLISPAEYEWIVTTPAVGRCRYCPEYRAEGFPAELARRFSVHRRSREHRRRAACG